MSGVFNVLGAGTRGMLGSQLSASMTAQNAANVATEGYARRAPTDTLEGALLGRAHYQRVIDPFLERRMLGALSTHGEASAAHRALAHLDTAFAEGEASLGSALDTFLASTKNLSSRPNDTATRDELLASAAALAQSFADTATQLSAARSDINGRITHAVDEVNQRLKHIGALGAQIAQAEIHGQEASDLRDQRDLLLREVAERVPITVLEGERGALTVTLAGSQALVSPDGRVNELSVRADANGDVRIYKTAAGEAVDVTRLVSSGSIGGHIKARDGALTDAQNRLDQLAFDVANAYNAVHSAGVGLDGASGRNLFEPPAEVAGAARNMRLSEDVAGHPERIAAALDPASLPSDNRNALSLSDLSSAGFALGGMTVTEALASLVGSSGMAVQSAARAEAFASGALSQVQALHDSVSGVSSDEEMVALMRYQRAYEASLKVIQVADEMLGELMNLKR